MQTLSQLNSFSSNSVAFTADTQTFSRGAVGTNFTSPVLTWIPVQQLGPPIGFGAQISYNVSAVANTTVTFDSVGSADNPLTVTTPATGVYVIKGIRTIIDYNAAAATVRPPVGFAGTVNYSATYTNVNTAVGNFVVSYVAVPEA